ncbi:uncharacterized protein I206_105439 [Kwoniella pini CBS 10737]|uniref:RecQ-mediated genome instability protein 1 n=1 Tax=Kwoniella pini CBS 10737 TaxID=1296096 RepID=A0A1B9I488_9TREE|nr:uncharacterized protein I206_03655 [Kwoniella pini CBS 10737]OCF50336.1 hypothetical protein I206_03655 [Kwoniella pini CBS 10737]
MMDTQPIVSFLKRTYPNPEVDPVWVQECTRALLEAGQEVTIDTVHTQFLYSDLAQSTLASRTFPSGDLHEKILFQRPTILQMHHISEIGHSAFQIKHTMEQRSEVLSGQSLIRRMEDEVVEDEQEQNIDQGKVPPYPRSMLKLELSDGRRIIKAMEYKKINNLVLGQTSLGCKVVCNNVKCLRDTLLLTPQNTQVLESSVEYLELTQKEEFMKDLNRRMGKLDDGSTNIPAQRRIKPPPPIRPKHNASIKPPAAQIRSKITHSPEIIPTAGPSRTSHYFQSNPAEQVHPPHLVRPKPIRAQGLKSSSSASNSRKRSMNDDSEDEEEPISKSRRSRTAAKLATAKVTQLYHDIPDDKFTEMDEDFGNENDDEFDYDIDESFIRQINEVEAKASGSGIYYKNFKSHKYNDVEEEEEDDDDDDDFMIIDEKIIKQIDNLSSSSFSNQNKGIGKEKENQNQNRKNYINQDNLNDEKEILSTEDDEFELQLDDKFIKNLNEIEFKQNKKDKDNYKSFQNKNNRLFSLSLSRSNSDSLISNSNSNSINNSQKENIQPEIIEISD